MSHFIPRKSSTRKSENPIENAPVQNPRVTPMPSVNPPPTFGQAARSTLNQNSNVNREPVRPPPETRATVRREQSSGPINLQFVRDEFEKFWARVVELENSSNFVGQMVFSVIALELVNLITATDQRLASSYSERQQDLRKRVKALQLLLVRNQYSGNGFSNTSIARMGTEGGVIGRGDSQYEQCCNYMISFYQGSPQCENNWFRNIVGLKEQKRTLSDYLIDPLVFEGMQDDKPRGILFYGPPGTGKTLLAKAAVNELMNAGNINPLYKNVKFLFYAPSADSFKNEYFGGSEKAIKAAFDCASRAAKKVVDDSRGTLKAISILFLDEFDSLAPSRNSGDKNAAITVNALLQAMDGIASSNYVMVIAASNYPWRLDPAILERFNRKMYVPLPSSTDIEELLNLRINRMLRKSLTKYSLGASEAPIIEKPREPDNCSMDPSQVVANVCTPPVKTEADNYNWYDQEFQTFFPNISQDDIKALSRYMDGSLPVNPLYGEESEAPKKLKLSNRQLDDIFKEVRNRALTEAKRKKVFLKKPNPVFPNKQLIFSIDSIPERDWEGIDRDQELYLSEPLRGSQDMKLVWEYGGKGQREVYLTNLQLYPVVDPSEQGAIAGYYGTRAEPWFEDQTLRKATIETASTLFLGKAQSLGTYRPKSGVPIAPEVDFVSDYYEKILARQDMKAHQFADTARSVIDQAFVDFCKLDGNTSIRELENCLVIALKSDNFVEAALRNAKVNQEFKNAVFLNLRKSRFRNTLQAVHYVVYQFNVVVKTDLKGDQRASSVWQSLATLLNAPISQLQKKTKKEIMEMVTSQSMRDEVIAFLDKLGSDTERNEMIYLFHSFKYNPSDDSIKIYVDPPQESTLASIFKKITFSRIERQELSQFLDQNIATYQRWRREQLSVKIPTEGRNMFSNGSKDSDIYQSRALLIFPGEEGLYACTRLTDSSSGLFLYDTASGVSGGAAVQSFLSAINGADTVNNLGTETSYFRISGGLFSDDYYRTWNSTSVLEDVKQDDVRIVDMSFGTMKSNYVGQMNYGFTSKTNVESFTRGIEQLRQSENLSNSSRYFLNWNLRYEHFINVMRNFSSSLGDNDEAYFKMYRKDASSVDKILKAINEGGLVQPNK